MKAITYSRYGGPEVLEYGEICEPRVGPDSVLVAVRAAAVNPVDWKVQAGYLDALIEARFPVVPGWDMSGVVVRPGVDTPEYKEGDEVVGYVREDFLAHGTFAEYVAAPVRTLAHKPRSLDFEQGAALPLAGLTAYQALTKVLDLAKGETILVHAAAGGVGTMAVQLAVHLGARVIGTASEYNHDYLRELGAEPVVYGPGLADRVRAIAPDGVDAALDLVGGEALAATGDVLKVPGRVVSIADPQVMGLGGRFYWTRPDAADLAVLAELAATGALRVEVARSFPLERAAEAQRLSAERHTRGKIVVTVGSRA